MARSEKVPLVKDYSLTIWLYCQAMSSRWKKSSHTYDRNLGHPKEDEMEQVNTNVMIWGLFMNASMKAVVHLGKDYEDNLRVTKDT